MEHLDDGLVSNFDSESKARVMSLFHCILQRAFSEPSTAKSLFHSEKIPNTPIFQYVWRILKKAKCHSSTLIIALIYLNRIVNERMPVTHFTVHRLLFTCIMMACKFFDDHTYDNAHWSKFGLVFDVKQVNQMETSFLCLLRHRLFITTSEFVRVIQDITDPTKHPHCGLTKCHSNIFPHTVAYESMLVAMRTGSNTTRTTILNTTYFWNQECKMSLYVKKLGCLPAQWPLEIPDIPQSPPPPPSPALSQPSQPSVTQMDVTTTDDIGEIPEIVNDT